MIEILILIHEQNLLIPVAFWIRWNCPQQQEIVAARSSWYVHTVDIQGLFHSSANLATYLRPNSITLSSYS